MSSIGPKLVRLRLDPESYEGSAAAGAASRWLAVSIVRRDVEPGSPPPGISQPLGR